VASRSPHRPLAALAAALFAFVVPAPGGAEIDGFYAALLIDGAHAYDRRDFPTAVRHLRLACFGCLDEPPVLAGCLIRLAAAQAAVDDKEGFAESFRRIVEVEERFGAYGRAEVPAAVRTAFEERATATIPTATLAAVPAFAPLAKRKAEAERLAALPPKERRRLEEERKKEASRQAAAEAKPARRREAGAAAPAGDAVKAAPTAKKGPAPAPAPPVAAPPAPAQLTPAELAKMQQVRQLLASSSQEDLRQALKLAREVADAHAAAREAQHLAGEAAYRSARWQDATTYFRRGGDPGDTQPELLFYMAVALYESGDRDTAASVLERSLPNLERTPYVESYAKRILGPRNGSLPGR
jgi:hypothetical protein